MREHRVKRLLKKGSFPYLQTINSLLCVSIGVIHGNRASSLGVSGETRAKAFNSPRIPKIVLDIVIIMFLEIVRCGAV